MDTGELGPPSPATPVKVKFWNSLAKYTDASKATSIVHSSSQLSGMSTASSSQSEIGFFGQATRLVTNMLDGGKKAKPEVKSLQLAAAAAKKVFFFDCFSLNFMLTTPSPLLSLQLQHDNDNQHHQCQRNRQWPHHQHQHNDNANATVSCKDSYRVSIHSSDFPCALHMMKVMTASTRMTPP